MQYRAEGIFVEFYGWFDSPDSVFLAMEYLPLGDLAKCAPHILIENEVKQIAAQILQGLKIMHAEGFAHRDLKPQVRERMSITQVDTHNFKPTHLTLYRISWL